MYGTRDNGRIFHFKRPIRLMVSTITLWVFLFNSIGIGILNEAWARTMPYGAPSAESSRNTSPNASFLDLDIDFLALPSSLGQIKDSWKGTSEKTVIHIQDAHCNYAAQHKISDIIEYFNGQYGVSSVNLEGGSGAYDLSIFTGIQDAAIRDKVTDYFVKEGLVNGAEYYAIKNPGKIKLWGVEDTDLYLKNLNVYRDSLPHKELIEKELNTLTHVIDNLKRHIYTQGLKDIDEKYEAYKEQSLDFKSYLSYLLNAAKTRRLDINDLKNIKLLSKAMESEEDIDFRRANSERHEIIKRLEGRLSKNELEDLVRKTVSFKTEEITQVDFYAYLIALSKSINLDLTDFPHLQKYIAHISTYHNIDKFKLMEEVTGIEDRIRESLYTNPDQKELALLSKHLALIKNLFSVTLTKTDYQYLNENYHLFDMANYVNFISKKAPVYGISTDIVKGVNRLDEWRDEIIRFYKYSFERDNAFLKNLKYSDGSQVSIIVTGGFHTENLCQLFKDNGISYISIMPNFKNSNGYECPYFSLLAGEECDFQKRLLPIVASASSIQIASMLSSAISSEVWGRANIDAFRAAVLVQEQIAKGREITDITRDGDDVIFHMADGTTERMTVRTLLDAVHQHDIDGQMEGLSEEDFEDIENIDEILDELIDFLRSMGASQEVLDRVEALRGTNADGRALVRLVRGVRFRGHAGGQGIRLNGSLKVDRKRFRTVLGLLAEPKIDSIPGWVRDNFGNMSDEEIERAIRKAVAEGNYDLADMLAELLLERQENRLKGVLLHEIIAGLFGDHFLAEQVEQAFLAGQADRTTLANAQALRTGIWDMSPGERLGVDRDFAQAREIPLTEARERLISDRLGIAFEQFSEWKRNNPQKATMIEERLTEMSKRDAQTEVVLGSIDSKYVAIDRSNSDYSHIYPETEEIVKRLLKASGLNPDNFEFYLLDTSEESAFVVRYTNKIFVNMGLIKFIIENGGSKDALAFVLAHEIRHIFQWVDDTVEGKPIERGLASLLTHHADEYDADYALSLIDDAGYSVRDASFFFAKFLEKQGKRRRISLGFLTHPPTVGRLRKLERHILRFFWMNFFNRSQQFSDESKSEVNNRMPHRVFQENVARCESARDFKGLQDAHTVEEFIFAFMVARIRWKAEVDSAYNYFLIKFNITNSGQKEFYRIIFEIIRMDADDYARQRGRGIIVRGAIGEVAHYAVHELTAQFASKTISELIDFLNVTIPRPVLFDSYGSTIDVMYDFNYSAYASSVCYALGERIKRLYEKGKISDIDEFLGLMNIFYNRYLELYAYSETAFSRDVETALETMLNILLKVLNQHVRSGNSVSAENMDTLLNFIDILQGQAKYSTGEETIKFLCEFMKNAPLENKNQILKWIVRGDAEKSSTFRNYFFQHMARDPELMDILPGMGESAEADLDILFQNQYFTKHALFSSVGIGKDDDRWHQDVNILIRVLNNLSTKYGLSPEQVLILFEQCMNKLHSFTLTSEMETVYRLMFDEMCGMEHVDIRISQDTTIDRTLHPQIKRLIYFYKQGGVLSFSDIRSIFYRITQRAERKSKPEEPFTAQDVKAFYTLLISQATNIQNRYKEDDQSKKRLRWNKYILPFALYLSFDQQALDEKESKYESTRERRIGKSDGTVETRPGRPTRFGRFIGEFHSWGLLGRFADQDDYQKTKTTRGRGVNRIFLTGENADALLRIYDYILSSDKSFDALLNELLNNLPATSYRNFALYILFVEKFLRGELGVDIDNSRMFDLEYIQQIMSRLDKNSHARAFEMLNRITTVMVRDAEMADMNEPNQNVLGKLDDTERKRISDEHATEENSYYLSEYTELGGPVSQLDVFVGLLAEQDLIDIIESDTIPFSEKVKAINKLFPRKSNTRDRFIVHLIEQNLDRLTSQNIKVLLSMFNSEPFRDKYAVLALEKLRDEKPRDFQTLEGELKWVVHFFPEFSPTRDDILLQIIDEKAKTPSDMQKARKYLLQAPENVREKKQARIIFGSSVFDQYLSKQTPKEKMEFLLWVFGISDVKPFFIKRFEHEYNVSLNNLRSLFVRDGVGYYKNVGNTALEDFLERMLLGDNGIFYDETSSKEFLESLFNMLMPSHKTGLMKALYDAVFNKADVNRKYAIVVGLLKNYSQERQLTAKVNEARAIRVFLESIGLIGVKLGQFLSTNENIPEHIRNELKTLKDRAPLLNKDIAFDMLSKIYGSFGQSPISELLECIGRASIKVVYRARLKDGRETVVKIKRPEVEKKVDEDLEFLRSILSEDSVRQALADEEVAIPSQLANRVAEMIREEIDLRGEVTNQARLAANIAARQSFKRRLLNRIFQYFMSRIFAKSQRHYSFMVPVTHDVKNNTLIIEEFAQGRPINENDRDAMSAVAQELIRQIFIDGFYHADPHTGNIFIDEENGIIYFIDVGSAAQLSFKNRYILYKLLRALESGNRKKVSKIVAEMTGHDSPDLTKKVQRIANSEANVIEKLISTYQLLEDSGIALDPEQMSIFRCFAQGELLFKSALTSPVSGAGLFGAGTEAEFHEGVMGQGDVDATRAEVLVSQIEPLLESLEVPLSGSQSFTFEINDQNRTVEVAVDSSLEEMFEINHNGTVIKINPDKVKERFGDKADVDTIIQAIIVHEMAEALGKQLGYNHNTRHTASLILEGLLASTAPTVREALIPLWQARPVAFGAGDVAGTKAVAETQIDAAKGIITDLRQGTTDIIVMPGSDLYKGQQFSVGKETERKLRRDYGQSTVPLHYAYGANWQDNLRPVLERALSDLQSKIARGDKTARVLVNIPQGGRSFVENILNSDEFKDLKNRFSIVEMQDIPENGVIDEVMHIILGKGLLNYERYRQGDYGTATLDVEAKIRLAHFIQTLVSNPEAIDFDKDPDIINKLLEGIVSLRIKPIDFTEIQQWKEAQDEALRSV